MAQDEHPLKVAIFGTGLWAKNMMRVLLKLNRTVTAVCGVSIEKAQSFISEFPNVSNITPYDNFITMLENDSADYVYVATSNDMHMAHALDVMFKGKNVLVEKSMVVNVSELAQIQSAIESEKRIYMESNTALCSPLLRKLGSYIREQTPLKHIGSVGSIAISYGETPDVDPNNRYFNQALGGGVMGDIGSFALAATVVMLGTDVQIVASTLQLHPELAVDVRCLALLEGKSGVRATLNLSFMEMLPVTVTVGTNEGFGVILDYPRSSVMQIMRSDMEPVIRDLKREILEERGLDYREFSAYRDLSLALVVLDFENAVAAGYDRTYAEDLTHFEESTAVVRLTSEIFAQANIQHKTRR